MNSSPLFTDLDSIFKAASLDAASMSESSETISQIPEISEPIPELIPGSEATHQSMPSMSEMMDAIGNLDNDQLTKMMGDSLSNITPEMMEQARSLANSGQAENIIRELNRRGVNSQALRSDLLRQRNSLRGVGPAKKDGTTKTVLYITRSRQIKERSLPISSLSTSISAILRTEAIELSCSRIAKGPLSGHNIKFWYNPKEPGKNRLASKIIGFPIGGEAILVSESDDLNVQLLNQALSYLS